VPIKKYELAITKAYKRDNKNLFKSIQTASHNKRVESKIQVADWQLKVMRAMALRLSVCVSVCYKPVFY